MLFVHETQAERCQRLGEDVHSAAVQLMAGVRVESEEKGDRELAEMEAVGNEFEAAGCEGTIDPFCDIAPPLYDETKCGTMASPSPP